MPQKETGYIVTKNNPYYPEVEYFETIEEANAQFRKWLEEMQSPDGIYKCTVTIAKVIKSETVNSYM